MEKLACVICEFIIRAVSLSELISILTFLSIVIGGIFALHRWNVSLKLKRAEYVQSLLTDIRTNPNIDFHLFDYDNPWYNESFHNGSKLEGKVTYTLSYFSYICYLYEQKILTQTDFIRFKYFINRVLSNEQLHDYFYNLYHFSSKQQLPISYIDLFNYAKENGYFDDEFWNEKSKKYPHYLNF